MCWREECLNCHKFSWGGCGKHIQCVLASIPLQNRCECPAPANALHSAQRARVPNTVCTTVDNELILGRMDNLLTYISSLLSLDTDDGNGNEQKKRAADMDTNTNNANNASLLYLDKSWMDRRQLQMQRLNAHQLFFRPDLVIDESVKCPIGHSTHNLFLYSKLSKKKKEFYFVTHQQSTTMKCDLKQLRTQLKCKELRLATNYVKEFFMFEKGCITALSLLNMTMDDGDSNGATTKLSLKWVLDESLVNAGGVITICAGCLQPLDHTQHHVVDIDVQLLLKLVHTHTGLKPIITKLPLR